MQYCNIEKNGRLKQRSINQLDHHKVILVNLLPLLPFLPQAVEGVIKVNGKDI